MTCKFYIEPPKILDFNIPKRVLGPKGRYIGNIIKKCQLAYGKKITKLMKIKLRGKGIR